MEKVWDFLLIFFEYNNFNFNLKSRLMDLMKSRFYLLVSDI